MKEDIKENIISTGERRPCLPKCQDIFLVTRAGRNSEEPAPTSHGYRIPSNLLGLSSGDIVNLIY